MSNNLFILTSDSVNFSTNIISANGPSFKKGATFATQTILNRSSDVVTYSHSGNATLDVTLELYAVAEEADDEMIQSTVLMLKSLTHPVKSGVKGPALCKITLGGDKLIKSWGCVCTNVGRAFMVDYGFTDNYTARAMAVTMSFMEIEDDSVDASDVNTGGGNYKDPSWYLYGSGQGGSGMSGTQQLQSTLQNLANLGASNVGITVGSLTPPQVVNF